MMGFFFLLAAATWVVAVCETVLHSALAPLDRVLLFGGLVLLPPVGLLAWLVSMKRQLRERRQMSSG
jgi:hypothetical protein